MNKSFKADLVNDLTAAIGWNRLTSEKAGQGRIKECRERCEWLDKVLRQALERIRLATDE